MVELETTEKYKKWINSQVWECEWWKNKNNIFGEDLKQLTYAHRMRLVNLSMDFHWPFMILKINLFLIWVAAPDSILLKTCNIVNSTVVDPCGYPDWVKIRYKSRNIEFVECMGEIFNENSSRKYDEVWMYNVLQHVYDVDLVIKAIKRSCNLFTIIRIFEWVDTQIVIGHPNIITVPILEKAFGEGIVEYVDENGCYGKAFYGVFKLCQD